MKNVQGDNNKHSWPVKIEKFGVYLKEVRGLSSRTVYGYMWVSCAYCSYTKKLNNFTRQDLLNFIQHSLADRSGTYKRWCCQVLKAYYDYLEEKWSLNKAELPKYSKPKRTIIPLIDAKKVLDTRGAVSVRDFAILKLIFDTGLRRSEVVGLIKDAFKPPVISVQLAKGEDLTVKMLTDSTTQAIQAYVNTRKDKLPWLFIGNRGKLTPQYVTDMFRRVFSQAGLAHATPHAARRSLVTWLHAAGMSVKDLQEAMGWKTPSMPLVYIQADKKEVADKMLELSPLYR